MIVLELHIEDQSAPELAVSAAQARLLDYARELGLEVRVRNVVHAPSAHAKREHKIRFSIG